jgi:predicted dehydrogenase
MFLMSSDSKWVNTAWRKTPEYQGGFLLDGGVHFAAATRLLLGATGAKESLPASVVARTNLTHEYLAPVDSIAAVVTTRSGASGTYQHAVSSTALSAFEFDVGYEHGAVRVVQDTVTIVPKEGKNVVEEFGMAKGVEEEVAAWVEGMRQGKMHELLRPEEALKDLEFLEKMFVSAEKEGAVQRYELQ